MVCWARRSGQLILNWSRSLALRLGELVGNRRIAYGVSSPVLVAIEDESFVPFSVVREKTERTCRRVARRRNGQWIASLLASQNGWLRTIEARQEGLGGDHSGAAAIAEQAGLQISGLYA